MLLIKVFFAVISRMQTTSSKTKKMALIETLRIIKEVYKPNLEAMILHHISISYKDKDHYENVMVIWDITDESWKSQKKKV